MPGTRTLRSALLLCLMSVCVATATRAGRQVFTIKEHLNRQWTGEFVSYPVEFKARECVADSVQLTGPEGRLPVQLFDAELSAVQGQADTYNNLIDVYKAMGGGWVDEAVSLAPAPEEVVSTR